MSEVEEIYRDFYEIESDDSMGIVRIYEKNQIFLDNKSNFKDKEDFDEYVLLVGFYVLSLEKVGKYNKAIKHADRLMGLIESKKDEFDINQKDCINYWNVLTIKGRSLYNLKDYKNAIPIFEKILDWDNDNDNIKIWLHASKSKKRNSINKYFYLIASILIIGEIFFGDQIENPRSKLFMTGIGFILFMIALINEYLVDKILKMINKE